MTTYIRTPLTGEVDFTMMYAAHDAFSRDLRRMTDATLRGRAHRPAVVAGWQLFTDQLHIHHQAEDVALWPRLRAAVQQPAELLVLEQMEEEHAEIEPHLEAIGAGLTQAGSGLADSVNALSSRLSAHLEHEETAALPLVERYLGRAGWGGFVGHIRSTQGMRGAAQFLPWLLDDAPAKTVATVLGILPPPARLVYRRAWAPRYRRRGYWVS